MERRKSLRTRFPQPISLWSTEPQEPVGSLACDLSEGGVRINLPDFVAVGTEYTLQLPLFQDRSVECPGRVVWVQKLPHMDRYQAGIRFKEEYSAGNTRQQIRKFVDQKR